MAMVEFNAHAMANKPDTSFCCELICSPGEIDVDQSIQYRVDVHHRSHLSAVPDAVEVTAGLPGALSHDLTTKNPNIDPFIGV